MGKLKCKVFGKSVGIPFDCLIQCGGSYAVKPRELRVHDYSVSTHDMDGSFDLGSGQGRLYECWFLARHDWQLRHNAAERKHQPDQRLLAIQPLEPQEDDALMDELLASDPKF